MMAKLAGLAGLMAGMSHFASKGRKKKMNSKADLNKDGKLSGYEKARSKAIQKSVMKKKLKKFKDIENGKVIKPSGKSAAHGKYKK